MYTKTVFEGTKEGVQADGVCTQKLPLREQRKVCKPMLGIQQLPSREAPSVTKTATPPLRYSTLKLTLLCGRKFKNGWCTNMNLKRSLHLRLER